MQYSAILDSGSVLKAESELRPPSPIQAENRMRPDSYDSAHEFSLERLVESYRLVEIEEFELDRYVFDDACLHIA